jgi:DNA-binding response OmpR family regulator
MYAPAPTSARAPRVLLAEDDNELRKLLAGALRRNGYDVIEICDGLQLRDRLEYSRLLFGDHYDFDLIISDVRMPGLGGLDVVSAMADVARRPPVIMITAFGDQQTYIRAMQLKAVAFFDKPFDIDSLCGFIRNLLPYGPAPTCLQPASATPAHQERSAGVP